MAADPESVDVGALLELIERLERLLESSGLSEIEIEAAGTGIVLRAPAALAAAAAVPATSANASAETQASPEPVPAPSRTNAVVAPLTGLYYQSPSPGAEPYVQEGGMVHVGQVIGLIEAMKLFNEIKSDVAGRVVRICVESGALVKAKEPLIEIEPA